MRLARSLSTSSSRSKQALYEPYIATLTQEKVKALRKVMKMNEPRLHSRIPVDVERVMKLHKPSMAALQARQVTIQHLETIINATYGPQYNIIDISLGQYATDLDLAPLDLAIIDNSQPDGFPPGTEGQPLTGPYDHRDLARLLQKEGFMGEFIDGDAITMMSPEDRDTIVMEVEDIGPPVFCPPWPNFNPLPAEYISYPPVLAASHLDGATIPFNISPPMPTHLPLRNLLREYLWDSIYKDLVSIAYLWARSINIDQMTPTCIALMVIGYLQVRHGTYCLQKPSDAKALKWLTENYCGVWVRGEFPYSHPPRSFWIETAFLPMRLPDILPPYKRIKQLLYGFFEFWSSSGGSTKMFTSSQQYVSVGEGAIIDRAPTIMPLKALKTMRKTQEQIRSGLVPWSPLTPPTSWQSQAIVVQDPFIPSYNHARNMTAAANRYFHHTASIARRALFHGHPLGLMMGPSVEPDPYYKRYSTENLTTEAKMAFEALLPPTPVLEARKRTIERVNRSIRNTYGGRYHVEAFGSTRYGVSTASSDLDLILLDHERRFGFTKELRYHPLPEVYDVINVGKKLSRAGFVDVFAIPRAKVPIVRFVDPTTNLECDLNINDYLGLVNTRFIGTYCDLAPDLVRPMSLLVKRWAKVRYLNDPSGQYGSCTFSSYAINLMIIGYLQVRGILPSLHAGLQPLQRNATEGTFWVRMKGRRVGEACDVRFNVPHNWQPSLQLELGDALLGFFRYWGDEFDYRHKLLSVRHGSVFDRPLSKKLKREMERKTKSTAALAPPSAMDLYDEAREDEEDGALAAWRDEVEGLHDMVEEAEGIEKVEESEAMDEPTTHHDESDVYHTTAQEIDQYEVSALSNVTEQVEALTTQSSEPGSPNVTPSTEDSGQTTVMHSSRKFNHNYMVLPDPFRMEKNLASLKEIQINYFQIECRKAVHLIESGAGLKPLIDPAGIDKDDDKVVLGHHEDDKAFAYLSDEALSSRAAPRRGGVRLDRPQGHPAPPKKNKNKEKNDQQYSANSTPTLDPSRDKSGQ